MSLVSADCYFGDHDWHGTSRCHCGARLRCACGRFVRDRDEDWRRHEAICPTLAKLPPEDSPDAPEEARSCSVCGVEVDEVFGPGGPCALANCPWASDD